MSKRIQRVTWFINSLFFLLSFSLSAEEKNSSPTSSDSNYANCIECHSEQTAKWSDSDHDKAMQRMKTETVLGNFDNAQVKHHSLTGTLYKKNNEYWVSLSQEGKQQTYKIAYSFGHFPLQQYLVKTNNGKMQVLPFSWDSRTKENGGQRWFHIYQEDIAANDRLHWTQPLQNWNGMCADCHSDGLKRHYDKKNDTFSSSWNALNVGCLSCHDGFDTEHKNNSLSVSTQGTWQRGHQDTAQWVGEMRNDDFMWNCFSCHSLRSPLIDGFDSRLHFLDQFTPSYGTSPMYHADGQIKEEVYVMGSFMQSKMYQKGVTCIDCHDPHSLEVKIEGNGLCLQCHSTEVFNTEQHHGHNNSSTGSMCVNCHMPSTTYMGVDKRRDHSFKVPNPELSKELNTPLACLNCHVEKNHEWAKTNISNWNNGKISNKDELKEYSRFVEGSVVDGNRFLALLTSETLSDIQKGTLLQLLPRLAQQIPGNILAPYLSHKSAIIRTSAAQQGGLLSSADRMKYLLPLLNDQYRSVRVATVNHLLDIQIPESYSVAFAEAFSELSEYHAVSSWRGEGRALTATRFAIQGKAAESIQEFKTSIEIDPFYEGAYINLADIYRTLSETKAERTILQKGIDRIPTSATLHYSYGLLFIRAKQYNKALDQIKVAQELQPSNDQFTYTYILTLEQAKGKTQAKRFWLKTLKSHPNSSLLRSLANYFE